MGGSLLVGGENVFQLVPVFVQRVVDVDDLAAGVAKYHIGALFNQCANDDIGAGEFHAIILS